MDHGHHVFLTLTATLFSPFLLMQLIMAFLVSWCALIRRSNSVRNSGSFIDIALDLSSARTKIAMAQITKDVIA